jgi:hypothetical protein
MMVNKTITSLLPVNSTIHGTPFEDLINNSIGYFLELMEEETEQIKDGCFLDTAEAEYLDYWGKDYDIKRLPNESDEDYRIRLSIIPLERFTINTLYTLYDMQLLTKPDTTVSDLDLTLLSDNHLLADKYYVDCSDAVWNEVSKKFLTTGILWRYPHE